MKELKAARGEVEGSGSAAGGTGAYAGSGYLCEVVLVTLIFVLN